MAVGFARALGAGAPARVFPVIGAHARVTFEDLTLDAPFNVVVSPRHAEMLLVMGTPRPQDEAAIMRLHDQVPHRRASLFWQAKPLPGFSPDACIGPGIDPRVAIAETARRLRSGERASEPDHYPDEPPAPWEGEGDHGQGGVGMMGGVPYGRPMAMTANDLRDGLALDPYAARFGPYLSHWPPGLVLDLALQGDVIQKASVQRAPHEQGPLADTPLRIMARILTLLGLEAHATRFMRAAHALDSGKRIKLVPLSRRLHWSGAMAAIPPDLSKSTCVRRRLEALWHSIERGESPPAADPAVLGSLSDQLIGLEWAEALLVLNSFDTPTLRSMALHAPAEAEAPQ